MQDHKVKKNKSKITITLQSRGKNPNIPNYYPTNANQRDEKSCYKIVIQAKLIKHSLLGGLEMH